MAGLYQAHLPQAHWRLRSGPVALRLFGLACHVRGAQPAAEPALRAAAALAVGLLVQ